jgi:hypothetical protein
MVDAVNCATTVLMLVGKKSHDDIVTTGRELF